MTRLIDADALSEKLCETTIFIKDGEVFQRMINDAPTVADAVQIPIKLEKRYPQSRDEDITDAFMRGYLAGRSSADRPTGEWVPIEDGLPDINIKHKGMCGDPDWYSSSLVMIKTDEPYLDPLGYEVGQFEMSADGEMYDFYDGNYYIKLKNIIAWMPIKPYKGGEEE